MMRFAFEFLHSSSFVEREGVAEQMHICCPGVAEEFWTSPDFNGSEAILYLMSQAVPTDSVQICSRCISIQCKPLDHVPSDSQEAQIWSYSKKCATVTLPLM